MSEAEIRALLSRNGFSVANISYRLMEKGAQLEYRMTVRTMDSGNIEKLSKTLLGLTSIVEFNISMAGD
jgi:putative Mg2+ transporter-C (MgtC) family protein